MTLYLCSQSPRRRKILDDHNVSYTLIPNLLFSEPAWQHGECPFRYVANLAKTKCQQSKAGYTGFVMGVDTIVYCPPLVYGKPHSKSDARTILEQLMGRMHQVITACVGFQSEKNRYYFCIDAAQIRFKTCSKQQINQYLDEYDYLDKAGAYGIQDYPPFYDSHYGDWHTIMGLPIIRLLKKLKTYGIVNP